jgi:beta-aspartyl-peptidase (threonine type)
MRPSAVFAPVAAVVLIAATLPAADPVRWAIAVHGGAGVGDALAKDGPPDKQRPYEESLHKGLALGRDVLAGGGTALDACEKVCRFFEDDPLFNAGKGAVYNAVGQHELDASIMDGRTLACGAVAGVRTVKNPVSLARLVMTKTRHVLLAGDGAEEFATAMKVERVPNSYFDTPGRYEAYQRWLKKQPAGQDAKPKGGSTVGCLCLDTHGNLAAATSTGGLTGKRFGRVGDSPVIGAGTFADNRTCAVSCTGTGEEFIRHGVARTIANLMAYRGLSVQQAADELIHKTLKPDDGGCIAVSRTGEVAMQFNTDGMFRGRADSAGRFEIAVWPDRPPTVRPTGAGQ